MEVWDRKWNETGFSYQRLSSAEEATGKPTDIQTNTLRYLSPRFYQAYPAAGAYIIDMFLLLLRFRFDS